MGEMRYLQLLTSVLVSLGVSATCFADGEGRNAEKAFLSFESGTATAQKNLTLKRAEIYGFPAARVESSKSKAICEITVVTMDDKFEIAAGQKFELNGYSKDECAGHKHQQDREDCLAKQGRFLRIKLPPRKTGGERLAWLYCDSDANLDRSIDEFKKSFGISIQIKSKPEPVAPAMVTDVGASSAGDGPMVGD